ncbi:MAG: hypothetical protein ABTQ34_01150 [Bdellovibrionales bacterium]
MTWLARHKNWLMLLSLALILAGAGHPALQMATDAAKQGTTRTKADRIKLESDLRQIESDRVALRELSQRLNPESVERLLAPSDRLKAGTALEKLAASARLKGLSYAFGPERPFNLDTAGSGKLALAQSELTWETSAPLDQDIRNFTTHLHSALPGKLSLERLAIARTGMTLASTPLRTQATMLWLSNGSAP